jgi:iron complex transport system ATP-binding protein
MARAGLLILDEPCAGLDPVARERFLEFLERWVRREAAPALVLVTHHIEEIVPLFSHALVLRKGQVLKSGRKDEVLTSDVISRAFDVPVRITSHDGRYALEVLRRGPKED